jgi:hypothetical protein
MAKQLIKFESPFMQEWGPNRMETGVRIQIVSGLEIDFPRIGLFLERVLCA